MKRRNDPVLDFTPLLDVTMIILFFFVLFSRVGVDAVRQDAEQTMSAAEAAQSSAAEMMQEADDALRAAADMQAEAERKLEIMAEADAGQAEIAAAMDDYAAGRNLKLILESRAGNWHLRIRLGTEQLAALSAPDDAEALAAVLLEAGFAPEDVILCDLIYDADQPGSNQAYQQIRTYTEALRNTYPHMYISETDLSD